MKFSLLIFLLLLCVPLSIHAEDLNAGFVEGLWYAHTPLIAGQPTRIYVALRNNSESDLTGTVKFTDNGSSIGTANVSALPGRIVEAWIDWTPGYGDHKVLATLTNVKVHEFGESPEVRAVTDTLAEDALFADYDTDGDGILNQEDTDDDNDSMSDSDEITEKRNPLKADPLPQTGTVSEKIKAEEDERKVTSTITTPSVNASVSSGLETYLPEGRTQKLVEGITETISDTKVTLDSYRSKQKDELEPFFTPASSTVSSDTTEDGATITRSTLPKDEGFIESAIQGGKAIVGGMYRLLLTVVSKFLAHPAVLELILLLGFIYFIYRTARRIGRRRSN